MISSAVLQIIAMATMLVDHIGFYLIPGCWPLRAAGRLAFPIFAFLLVEGFKHTRSRTRYLLRLIGCAVLTQLLFFAFSAIFHYDYSHNVLFTFAFALIALICAEQGGFFLVAVPILALAAGAFDCEYGVFGVVLILGFYYADKLFNNNRPFRIASQFLILVAMMVSQAYYEHWAVQAYSIAAIIPIALYSGKKGRRLPRPLAYLFYPVHLGVILVIKLLLR